VYLFGQLPFTTVTTEGRTSKAWITANCARLEVLEAKTGVDGIGGTRR